MGWGGKPAHAGLCLQQLWGLTARTQGLIGPGVPLAVEAGVLARDFSVFPSLGHQQSFGVKVAQVGELWSV